ncbi:MAG: hypothetical protein ACPGO3_15925 [Magnetospiraceae bacterium]
MVSRGLRRAALVTAPILALVGVMLMVILPGTERAWGWVLLGLAVVCMVAAGPVSRNRL